VVGEEPFDHLLEQFRIPVHTRQQGLPSGTSESSPEPFLPAARRFGERKALDDLDQFLHPHGLDM